MTIYLTDDAFSVKAKRFNKMFTSILALFFLLRIANKSNIYALGLESVCKTKTFGYSNMSTTTIMQLCYQLRVFSDESAAQNSRNSVQQLTLSTLWSLDCNLEIQRAQIFEDPWLTLSCNSNSSMEMSLSFLSKMSALFDRLGKQKFQQMQNIRYKISV